MNRLLIYLLFTLNIKAYACWYHNGIEPIPLWHQNVDGANLSWQVHAEKKVSEIFNRAMKLLHSYEFLEAIWLFRNLQKIDPGFALAYWGEFMCGQMLVWYAQDRNLSRNVITKMQKNIDISQLPVKERLLIEASLTLFEERNNSDKSVVMSPLIRYKTLMEALHRLYPNDLEIEVWYGYSILSTRRGSWDNEVNKKAAEIFLNVLKENPTHPGALHYLLHATENQALAHLASHHKDNIATIMPNAIHAVHMPSHYYIAIGDWEKVIAFNLSAWNLSKKRAALLNISSDTLEFHGYGWIVYAYLQLGKIEEAFDALSIIYKIYDSNKTWTTKRYLLFARAGFLVDAPIRSMHFQEVIDYAIDYGDGVSTEIIGDIFSKLYVFYKKGNRELFTKHYSELQYRTLKPACSFSPPCKDAITLMKIMSEGLFNLISDNKEEGMKKLFEAAKYELTMVHEHGIPLVIKPANELLAEILVSDGNIKDACVFLEASKHFFPNRHIYDKLLNLN